MLEQFQNILEEPTFTDQQVLQQTRNLILNAMQSLFPAEFNFDPLTELCSQPEIASNDSLLTYHMVDYFLQLATQHFVTVQHYEALEAQTQRLQSTIRSHIRLEQEVKMYLQHLEYKISKYEAYFQRQYNRQPQPNLTSIPSQQETQLRKQRIALIRTNEHLQRQLEEKQHQLREKDHQLKERTGQLHRVRTESGDGKLVRRLANIKSQSGLLRDKGPGEHKIRSDTISISINGNNNEFNYIKVPE